MPRPKSHRHGSKNNVKKDKPDAEKENKSAAAPTTTTVVPIANKKARKAAKKPVKTSFTQSQDSFGLLVTNEFAEAAAKCTTKVMNIAKVCRRRNQKFRDTEFDILNDSPLCLWGLSKPDDEELNPADVMRVTDIYDAPQMFIDGALSSDIQQGALGDCWFLAALANVATVPGLLEKICVARDEEIGVYGFLFFRDDEWVDVIIDDQLYVKVPRFESLDYQQQSIYHNDPDLYNSIARKSGKILYMASGSTPNETWVPLIEKAYAKLHGNYAYLSGGFSMEAVEDLTGGVCNPLPLADILDVNRFWEELTQGKYLYGCSLQGTDEQTTEMIHGLHTYHAYTVLRAAEYNGKRFVLIRNPWGKGEWTGRWSDGAKEWTSEWLPALTALNHTFGNDGQFVMEYSDFLRLWTSIDCTRLFDSSWAVSSIWVQVEGLGPLHPWGWGDVSFTISVPTDTPAVIVLQQLDKRYFDEISGAVAYDFEFVVFKKGSTEEYCSSTRIKRWSRSRNVEIHLEAGDYVVHVRLDSDEIRESDYMEQGVANWDTRTLKRLLAQKGSAYSKASNFSTESWENTIPTPLETLAGRDLTQLEVELVEKKREDMQRKQSLVLGTATEEEAPEEEAPEEGGGEEEEEEEAAAEPEEEGQEATDDAAVHEGVSCNGCSTSPIVGIRYKCASDECPDFDLCQECFDKKEHDPTHEWMIIPVPRKVIHEGVTCNVCETCPIVGIRYKCLECEDFDVCQDCMDKKAHDPTHSMIMMPVPQTEETEEEPSDRAVHEGITCEGCKMVPIVGPRFKCMDTSCSEYNLCEECVQKGIHPASHQMLRLENPEEASHLHPGAGDGASVVLGLRVYTLKASVAVLGGQLKHGSLRYSEKKAS